MVELVGGAEVDALDFDVLRTGTKVRVRLEDLAVRGEGFGGEGKDRHARDASRCQSVAVWERRLGGRGERRSLGGRKCRLRPCGDRNRVMTVRRFVVAHGPPAHKAESLDAAV